jgi:hypothetical protein
LKELLEEVLEELRRQKEKEEFPDRLKEIRKKSKEVWAVS